MIGILIMAASSCVNENVNREEKSNKKTDHPVEMHNDEAKKEAPVTQEINGIRTIRIGKQLWMLDNLNVDTFRNGDPIPNIENDNEWYNAGLSKEPAWSFYDNNSCYEQYGKLYNFFAVDDPRELAPEGWRIPTDEDWIRLIKFLKDNYGDKLKSETGWFNDGNGTNESGYTGYPGGIRDISGLFTQYGFYGYWWTSSTIILDRGVTYYLVHDYGNDVFRGMVSRRFGMSVRCIKDYNNPDLPCE